MSASDSASSWSWVTSTVVTPCSRSSAWTSSRTRLRSEASSEENGSSSSSACGRRARARASATRCCSPPESSCGRRRASGAIPTISSSASTRSPRRSRRGEPEADVLAHAQMREQRALLGHVADAAPLGREVGAPVLERPLAERDRAALGALEAGDHAQQRRLAAAGQPQHGGQRARRHLELHALEHRRARVALPQVADRQPAHAPRSVRASVLMRRLSR